MARFTTFNEIGVGCRRDRNALLDEPVEQISPASRHPAIEPESVLVQVMVELFPGYPPLVDTQQPTLEQRGNTVEARKSVGSGLDLMNVPMRLEYAGIGGKSIGNDGRAGSHRLFDELNQAVSGGDGYLFETNSSSAKFSPLDGDKNDRLGSWGSSSSALAASPNQGFVHLDRAGKWLAIRTDHGPAQLMQTTPSSTIAAYPKGPLHSQRADPALLICEPPDRTEPKPQGQVAVLKDRPRGHGGHGAAVLALPELPL